MYRTSAAKCQTDQQPTAPDGRPSRPDGESHDHWYVAQLKPGGLARAVSNLHRQDVATFHPRHRVTVRRANRLVEREMPLFPGYIFVRAERPDVWRKINSTYGVARLVMRRSGAPLPVPRGVMQAIMEATDGEGALRRCDLREGDAVRITAGPLADFVGRVSGLPDSERVMVLLEVMGQAVRTDLRRRAVHRQAG